MPIPYNPLMDDLIYELAKGVAKGEPWALKLDSAIPSIDMQRFYQLYLAEQPLIEDIDLDALGYLAEYFYRRLLRNSDQAIAADLRDEPWAAWALGSLIFNDANDATNILLGSMQLDDGLLKFELFNFIQDRSPSDLRRLFGTSDLPQWYLINKNSSRWPELVDTLAEKMVRDISGNPDELAMLTSRDDSFGQLVRASIAKFTELPGTSSQKQTTSFLDSHRKAFTRERPGDSKGKPKRPLEQPVSDTEESTPTVKKPRSS